jgi:tyrosyl-tRNA synthetase
MFAQFISEYGTQILYVIFTAVAGYIGVVVKNIYQKYVNDQTKKDVVKTVVRGVEQIYKDLHGEEKLNKALEAASSMLQEKGISITDLELKMLIEAAVAEFNDVFNKTGEAE